MHLTFNGPECSQYYLITLVSKKQNSVVGVIKPMVRNTSSQSLRNQLL